MIQTPIQKLEFPNDRNVRLYCKREDLLPFSLGGNKVRIGRAFFRDMQWSAMPVMPSIFLSLTSAAMFSIRRALFTMYGISVTMISLFPFGSVSMFDTARTRILPRPVR